MSVWEHEYFSILSWRCGKKRVSLPPVINKGGTLTHLSAIFAFLKYCLGNEVDMRRVVASLDWRQLFAFSTKQALAGFCFDGIERMGREYPELLKGNPIGQDLLMTWMAQAQMIRRQNMRVNVTAAKLYAQLRKDGLRCCILKGQGNALMYANPYSRNPGDIDVWVNDSRERITEYAKGHFVLGDDIRYHHVETTMDGVPVELHFVPAIMNNPVYNRRLQKWFRRNADLQCSNVVSLPDGAGEIAVPTVAFNVIYQLCHLYHHFFDEGIGMRQLIDYLLNIKRLKYGNMEILKDLLILKDGDGRLPQIFKANTNSTNQTNVGVSLSVNSVSSVGEYLRELKRLGLWKFAGAVMWVLHEVAGLEETAMIVPMDEKRGRLLLAEIIDGGNFGRHASKYGHFTQQGMAKKYFLKIWRNMHFVRYYPAEALSEPVFRTWHFFWRKIWKH